MNNDNYKLRLEGKARPYLLELQRLLSEVVANTLPDGTPIVREISSQAIEEESKALFRKLYTFQSILSAAYNSMHAGGFLRNLFEYVNHFNKSKVINVPLGNSMVRTLIENINNLRENEFDKNWIEAFKSEGIDLDVEIDKALTELTRFNLQALASKYDLSLKRNIASNKYILFEKIDATKIVLCSVKFRKSIEDIRSIVLRSKDEYLSFKTEEKFTSKYLIVFLYTEEQDHTIDRFDAQFKKNLVEIDDNLVKSIFFIPISLQGVGSLKERIGLILRELNGIEEKIDDTNSPISKSWIISSEVNSIESRFIREIDTDLSCSIIKLRLPQNQSAYVYYKLELSPRIAYSLLGLIVKRSKMINRIDVEVSTKEGSDNLWFKLIEGDSNPIEISKNVYEICYSATVFKNWEYIKLDIKEVFETIFKDSKFVFNKIEGIKLSGELDIAKIYFE